MMVGDSRVTSNLARQIRSGKSGTTTVQISKSVALSAQASEMHLDGAHPASESASSLSSVEAAPKAETVPSVRKVSRFAKFSGGKAPEPPASSLQVFPDQQPEFSTEPEHSSIVAPSAAAPKSAPSPSRFAKLVAAQEKFDAEEAKNKTARVSMSAVKALTPLVAAISFKPGSNVELAAKSSALAELVRKVQLATTDVTMAMGPYFANSDWARGRVMVTMAEVAAKQWEKHGRVDIQDIGGCMSGAFRNPSPELLSALQSFENSDQYVEANNEQIAKARLATTVCAAAWEIHDWVTHEKLQVQDMPSSISGQTLTAPSRVFSYDLQVGEVVEVLLSRVIDEARGFELQIQDADMRLAHLQGTIRRLTQIVGAEYVTQTSSIQQWVSAAPDESEYDRRRNQAREQFVSDVVPRVMEWAHQNFASVEHRAQRMLDVLKQDNGNGESNRDTSH